MRKTTKSDFRRKNSTDAGPPSRGGFQYPINARPPDPERLGDFDGAEALGFHFAHDQGDA